MAIDASIYGAIQTPQAVNPLAQYGQAIQLQNGMQTGQLNALKLQEAQSESQQNALLRDAVSGFGNDTAANYQRILGTGNLNAAQGYKKSLAEQEKAAADAQKSKLENAVKTIEVVGQGLGWLRNNPSLENAQRTIQGFVQSGIMPEDVAQQRLADFQRDPSPEGIARLATAGFQAALSAKDQLPKNETQNLGGTSRISSIDPVTGQRRTIDEAAITQTQDNIANNARAAAEGAANRGVQIRGQNMTDARTREFNATKVEENNIKRDEKKATTDLTKNSQVASFDTMLGTLGRLSQHPGLSRSVGIIGALPTIPGSESANFKAELETFQSQAFIPMVAQLKGMGALSDAEGRKLTAAVGALNPNMGEKAFRESVERITQDMQAARQRVAGGEGGATGSFSPTPKAATTSLPSGWKVQAR